MIWLELECYENHYIIKAVVCSIEREGKAQKSKKQKAGSPDYISPDHREGKTRKETLYRNTDWKSLKLN